MLQSALIVASLVCAVVPFICVVLIIVLYLMLLVLVFDSQIESFLLFCICFFLHGMRTKTIELRSRLWPTNYLWEESVWLCPKCGSRHGKGKIV